MGVFVTICYLDYIYYMVSFSHLYNYQDNVSGTRSNELPSCKYSISVIFLSSRVFKI